ncbi:MAG: hypothetical protein KAY37_02230 [Phycisphaerae bacterium]|nr:hypothetical protein [Phycisphaerae bacterium]
METETSVTRIGMDIHRKFSKVAARDADGKVAWRQRLEHAERTRLREQLDRWPKGTPVILEGTFGWGWMTDELKTAGLDPHLASSSNSQSSILNPLWLRPKAAPSITCSRFPQAVCRISNS